jgi:hypothetical protein
METSRKIDEMLQLLVDQFVWSVRGGVGTFLTMEFGEPHRVVYEPRQTDEDASAAVRRTLARRLISIKGDVSLFVRDSQWSVFTKNAEVNWKSNAALVREMLVYHLDGQKVLSAVRRTDDTILEFDLGTTVRLGRSIYQADETSVLWSLRLFGNSSVGLLNSGTETIPDTEDGSETHTNSDLPPI